MPPMRYNRETTRGDVFVQMLGERYPWRYGLYLMAYYLSTSVYQNFISVYFASVGITTMQMAALMAAMPMVSIVTQPMWGALGDRTGSKRLLLCLLAIGSMGLILSFRLSNGFYYLLAMLTLFSALFTALQPLGDSIVLEALMAGRRPFGPLRLLGCLIFSLSSLLSGWFLEGRSNFIIYLTSGYLGLVALSAWALPKTPGKQRSGGAKGGFFSLLKDKTLRDLLIFTMLLQMTMGYFYSFFSVHFVSAPGGSSELLGLCYLISALAEVPFLLNADRLFERYGAGKLLSVTALALSVRWLVLGLTDNMWAIMTSQLLHGGGFIVMTVTMSKYISLTVPEALRSRGQMLLAVLGFGIARVVGSLGGGALAQALGMQRAFLVPCGVAALALLIFAPRYMGAPPLNGDGASPQ